MNSKKKKPTIKTTNICRRSKRIEIRKSKSKSNNCYPGHRFIMLIRRSIGQQLSGCERHLQEAL